MKADLLEAVVASVGAWLASSAILMCFWLCDENRWRAGIGGDGTIDGNDFGDDFSANVS